MLKLVIFHGLPSRTASNTNRVTPETAAIAPNNALIVLNRSALLFNIKLSHPFLHFASAINELDTIIETLKSALPETQGKVTLAPLATCIALACKYQKTPSTIANQKIETIQMTAGIGN